MCRFSFFGGTFHLSIHCCNLSTEILDLDEVYFGAFSDVFGQAYCLICNCVSQAFDLDSALWCDKAMLS